MSCIRFNTPAQRAQLRAMAPSTVSAAEAARMHPMPPITDSKIARLRLLAKDPNPGIRQSAAASLHAPDEVYRQLAGDLDDGVRACIARNEVVSCDILRTLADDPSERVRGFLAVNFSVPADTMERLAGDESGVVRGLVEWKTSLAAAGASGYRVSDQ